MSTDRQKTLAARLPRKRAKRLRRLARQSPRTVAAAPRPEKTPSAQALAKLRCLFGLEHCRDGA